MGYMVGNYVLILRGRVTVKRNFRPYNRRYTSPNEHFEYSYPLTVFTACLRIVLIENVLADSHFI